MIHLLILLFNLFEILWAFFSLFDSIYLISIKIMNLLIKLNFLTVRILLSYHFISHIFLLTLKIVIQTECCFFIDIIEHLLHSWISSAVVWLWSLFLWVFRNVRFLLRNHWSWQRAFWFRVRSWVNRAVVKETQVPVWLKSKQGLIFSVIYILGSILADLRVVSLFLFFILSLKINNAPLALLWNSRKTWLFWKIIVITNERNWFSCCI